MSSKKRYILMLSQCFPAYHPKAGQMTGFEDHLLEEKIHTLRANAELWIQRAEEINQGRAVLVIRKWTGRPYISKQETVCVLTRIGTQRISLKGRYTTWEGYDIPCWAVVTDDEGNEKSVKMDELAYNDGLSADDFTHWFRQKGKSDFSGVIIHFTDFRY